EGSREVFTLRGTEIELHFFHLKMAGRPVVHDHVPEDVFIGLRGRNVLTAFAENDCGFQLEIEFFLREFLHRELSRSGHRQMVREVEDREAVEFGDHRNAAVPTGGFDVLAKGVTVAHGNWTGYRRKEFHSRLG